ncbi:MAG: hypothetical protein LBR91_01135, partial [Puniceicoccales bacterium]|nr:hypothetical protein [Puniceicoccales bacterium]
YDDVVRYKHAGAYVSTDSLPYFADFLKRPIINIERTTHDVFVANFSVPGLSELGCINHQIRYRDQIDLSFDVRTGSFNIDQAGSFSRDPEASKFASIASEMGYLPNGVDEKLAVKILRDKNHGDRNGLLFQIMRRVFTNKKAIHITMPLKLKKLPSFESEQHFQTLLPNNKLPRKKKTEWS